MFTKTPRATATAEPLRTVGRITTADATYTKQHGMPGPSPYQQGTIISHGSLAGQVSPDNRSKVRAKARGRNMRTFDSTKTSRYELGPENAQLYLVLI